MHMVQPDNERMTKSKRSAERAALKARIFGILTAQFKAEGLGYFANYPIWLVKAKVVVDEAFDRHEARLTSARGRK